MKPATICLLTVGHEILIGQIVDTNSAWLGEKLTALGMPPTSIVSIGDEEKQIVDTLQSLSDKNDVVIMTGGLGPTKDDITVRSIAKFLEVPLVFYPEVYERIVRIFEKLNRPLSPSHKEQCYLPEGVELMQNNMGTAPGMVFRKGNFTLVSMPGVPFEMKAVFQEEVLPRILIPMIRGTIRQETFVVAGMGETEIENMLQPIIDTMPESYSVAYLPGLGQVRVRLTAFHKEDKAEDETMFLFFSKKVSQVLGKNIIGQGETNLETVIGVLCRQHGIRIGTLESCTGGRIASRLASIAGASDYYTGSIVAYSNHIKSKLLGVSDKVLEEHGAVSEETVKAMVSKGLELLEADVAVAVSGIAGPTGGTDEKPVGTVWIAVGSREKVVTKLLKLGKKREQNIQLSAQGALNMMRLFILDQYSEENQRINFTSPSYGF